MQFANYKGVMIDAKPDYKNVLMQIDSKLIVWSKSGNRHKVRYGLQVNNFTGKNADVEAAKNFGLCCRHNLECNGKL